MTREDLKPLIEVLKQGIANEQERIRRAEQEIFKLRLELLDLDVELPIGD
jgi:hypothetical protein